MFFRKRHKTNTTAPPIANSFWRKVKEQQVRLAAYLQGQTNHLPPRTLRYLLLAFCLLSVSVSVGVVVRSLQERSTTSPKIAPIQLPAQVLKTGSEHANRDQGITQKEYHSIQRFHQYLDSLRRTPEGRYRHDRLCYGRRPLLDSLRQLELLYQQQNLKQP
jgi:hypothetical protein